MLKEFRVKNFKSIREEQVFTMEACPRNIVSEYPDHVIEIGNERLLKVASMYGPNGGGKTNLLKALTIFAAIIVNNLVLNDTVKNENYYPSIFLKNENTEFTWFFIKGDYEIGYKLVVDMNNLEQLLNTSNNTVFYAIDYRIVYEELVVRPLEEKDFKELFTRNEKGIVKSDVLKNIDLIKEGTRLNNNNTFVNYFSTTFKSDKYKETKPIFETIKEIKSYHVLKRETAIFNYLKPNVDLLTPFLEKTKEFLNQLDFRIDSLFFKEKDQGTFLLYVRRKTIDGNFTEMPLQNESNGTIKAVNIVLDVLSKKDGEVFIADDFDSFLHPKIIKALIDLFTSKENINKQLIINSHDMVNMNNSVFRRDEIWFAYRDDTYSTIYKPLSNIVDYKGNMVRKDAVYGKQYLEGRYGADPFIKKGLNWNND